jgi:hypothetical protein
VAANAASGAVKLFSPKRRVVAAAVFILLALFLARPGASRLKARITNSIARAVARPADVGSVHLRFLPRPGFDLENLVIYEDPAFGAEPMLRAPEVTAVVRLTSLLRGRVDIARLELTEPSLNLVHRPDGRWNWEELLERSARTPLAPTAKSKSEARPGFPYIEATSGRINFKTGQEKKPFALLNADFALWQESENAWGVRLRGQPLRTDMSLSDTGLLRLNGTWQRAGSLRETPLQFGIEWTHAQLGQLTKLVSGYDKGWRGEVQLEATLSGIPAAMQVTADSSIRDFHRYDIPSGEGLRLAAHCDARYSSAEAMLHDILCSAPVGDGMITLHGEAGLPGGRNVDLSLNLDSIPANSAMQLARRAKKNLPADLLSTGIVQGNFSMKEDAASVRPEFRGHGEITDLHLRSISNKIDVVQPSIPFVLSYNPLGDWALPRRKSVSQSRADISLAPDDLHVECGPFPVALGRPTPAQMRGWFGRSGYSMAVRGDAEISRALRLAGLLGLPAIRANVEGAVQVDLDISGSWAETLTEAGSGFSAPAITGTAQLHNVRASMRGVNSPIEISSGELRLLNDEVRLEKLSARAADARWTGSLALPRGCGNPGACLVRFNLNTEEVGLSDLSAWLKAQPSQRPWYAILSTVEPASPSFLQSLHATGKVNAGRLRIRNIIADKVSAALDLDHGKLEISRLGADLLGGKHRGEWQFDFSAAAPVYKGTGTLTGISLAQVADAMHDPWISGTAAGTYQISASGANATGFWQSATGELQFELRDGVLSHLALASDEGPLQVSRWQDHARLRGGKIEFENSKLLSPAGVYEISGDVSLARVLDLKLTRGTDARPGAAGGLVYSVTGTLAEPLVALTPVPETQAQLKP